MDACITSTNCIDRTQCRRGIATLGLKIKCTECYSFGGNYSAYQQQQRLVINVTKIYLKFSSRADLSEN